MNFHLRAYRRRAIAGLALPAGAVLALAYSGLPLDASSRLLIVAAAAATGGHVAGANLRRLMVPAALAGVIVLGGNAHHLLGQPSTTPMLDALGAGVRVVLGVGMLLQAWVLHRIAALAAQRASRGGSLAL